MKYLSHHDVVRAALKGSKDKKGRRWEIEAYFLMWIRKRKGAVDDIDNVI